MSTHEEKLQSFLREIGIDEMKSIAVCDGGRTLDFQFEITSEDFLNFSQEDIKADNLHGLVNGLSNAKRAIDSQVDKIMNCFHLNTSQFKKLNTPSLRFLDELGVIAPNVLNKIRKTRHLLEHEYKVPSKQQVEDAIDVAELFIVASNRTLDFFPNYVLIANKDESSGSFSWFKNCITIENDWKGQGFLVGTHSESMWDGFNWENEDAHEQALKAGEMMRAFRQEFVVSSTDPMYYKILRLFVRVQQQEDRRIALENPIELILSKQ